MRAAGLLVLGAIAVCLGSALPARAGGPNPDKYPLRVYIFRFGVQPVHSREPRHEGDMEDYVSGIGQADLFENGEPLGFQFTYSCMVPMRASAGHATFPARWKKRGNTLEILLPQRKKPENMDSCELQAEIAAGQAYYWKNGAVAVEPSAALKKWMVDHNYDPEQGSEEPVLKAGETGDDDPMLSPQ